MKDSLVMRRLMSIGLMLLLVTASLLVVYTAAMSRSAEKVKEYTGARNVLPNSDSEGREKPLGKPPTPSQVDKWAVVIGISDYRGVGNDLMYADDDAVDMYDYLIAKGYPDGNIKLLLNSKATARNIMSAIDWMNRNEKKPTSEVVFFYSGHGSTYDGYDDGDSEYTDEAIVSTDLYLILDGQLRTKFSTYTSQKIAFVFDSCFSGGMDDLVGAWTGSPLDGRIVAAASGETEYSWEDDLLQNGVYTYYFIIGLNLNNNIEDAHAHAAPLAHDYVLEVFGEEMNPQLYDHYPTTGDPSGKWSFV